MKKLLLIITAASFLSPHFLNAGDGVSSITINELRSHVEFLASPELEGREAGYRGAEAAARYISTRFKSFGLQALPGAPDYYQPVPLVIMSPDFEKTIISIVDEKGAVECKVNRDLFFFPKGGDDDHFSAPVALCGYGISAPELGYDDYRDADVEGKIALIMNREPQLDDSSSIFNGARPTKYSIPMVKARTARSRGAKALMIMRPPTDSHPPIEETLENYRKGLEKPIVQLAGKMESLPVFYLKDETAALILAGKVDIGEYYREIEETLEPNPIEIEGITVDVTIRFRERRESESANVMGFFPGTGSESVDETLIIGAHYDHEGVSGEDIFYGADDNASGVAGLLEMAEAFSMYSQKQRRSLLFIAFTAEEKGALGSLFYTMNPILPLEKTVAMINLDEIGRNGAPTYGGMHSPDLEEKGKDYLMVCYSAQTPIFEELNKKANKPLKLKLDFDPNVHFYGSSDQVHFHDRAIPSLFYFTGFQPDYHTPRDTPDKINYPKMERIVRLVFKVSLELLDMEVRPAFDQSIKEVTKKKRMSF